MPYIKGINDPLVRAKFLQDRRATLTHFDALRAEKVPAHVAAKRCGYSFAGIKAIQRSVEQLGDPDFVAGAGNGSNIDLGLALLSIANHEGEALTDQDIAAWCDCSRSHIWMIGQRALRKLRRALLATFGAAEMQELLPILLRPEALTA